MSEKNWKEEAEKAWDASSWKQVAQDQPQNKQRPEIKIKANNGTKPKALPLADKSNPQELFQKIERFLARFVSYPSEHAHVAHVLWIAHTHCMDAWESTPRLAALSPEPASGKTRLLETTALVVPNPVEAINVSVAYLFRKVGGEDGPPTILFDEIDTVFGPKAKENEETRALLNAGHRRGAVAGRCVVKGKTVETEEIPAYCAVALAGLGWLPDTILSRSIIIRMRRRHAGENVEPYRHRVHSHEGYQLRDALAAWAMGAVDELTKAYPQMPEGVEDRNADVWEPLLAIADSIGGEWPKRARHAAVSLVSDAREAEPSLGIKLLADLQAVFGDAALMSTAAILKALHELTESPWNDLKGKPLNDRGLAVRLRPYGVKSKQVRVGDVTLKGYDRTDLYDAWKRYLPQPSDKTKTSETSETSSSSQGFDASDVSDAPQNVSLSVSDDPPTRSTDKSSGVLNVSAVSPVGSGRGGVPAPPDISGTGSPRSLTVAPSDFPDLPASLRRISTNGSSQPPQLCDYCGTTGKLNPYNWAGRPSGIILHSSCEGPWYDSERGGGGDE